ncbi:MAG: flagellar hook-length control protein FliK [Succinatimonas sp.]|nr:flagellar hook-length control protein FliK [Succinatimonas sp.]
MDTIDVDLKTSVDKSNTDLNKTESETQSGTAKAQINANATAKYISVISKHKGLLAESQARTFNQLNSSLNSFVKDSSSIAKESYNKDSAMMGHYRKLTVQVINRDPNLQEKVASDLSSQKEMVRSRDAASVLESDLKNLPKVLSEGTVAGQNLGKFICQSVVNLTDYENMGAGLQRDLAIRQVFAPTEELSLRSKQATAEVLAASIAYVKSNQPEVLTTLKPEQQEIVKPKPGSTTPQIMTRYLRQALDEFPDDSTYLDIFKQNKKVDEAEDNFKDDVSKETAKRIHDLIAKAALTARKSNLLSSKEEISLEKTVSTKADSPSAAANTADEKSVEASKLSLSELSARAAKLQQQFREERMRLASEGKLPDPAVKPNYTSDDSASNLELTNQRIAQVDRAIDERIANNSNLQDQHAKSKEKAEPVLSAEEIKKLAIDAVKEALQETVKSQIEANQNAAKLAATEAVNALKESVLSKFEANQNTTKEVAAQAVKEALEQSTKAQLEASQNSAKQAVAEAVNSLKESVFSKLEATQNSTKEIAAQAVREALEQSSKAQLEVNQNSARDAATEAVNALKESVLSKLTDNENNSKSVAEQAVKEALAKFEESQSQAKDATTQAVKDLKESVKAQLEKTQTSAKEAATLAAKTVLEENAKTQNENAQSSAKEAVKQALKEALEGSPLAKNDLRQNAYEKHQTFNMSFRGSAVADFGSYNMGPTLSVKIPNGVADYANGSNEVNAKSDLNSVNTEQKAEALKKEFLKSQAQDVREETAKDDATSFENTKVTDGIKTVGKADSTNTVSKSVTTEQKAFEFSTTNDDIINADTEDETYDVAVDKKNILSNEDDVKSDEVLTDKNSLKDKESNLKEPVASTEIDELVTDDNNVVAKDNEKLTSDTKASVNTDKDSDDILKLNQISNTQNGSVTSTEVTEETSEQPVTENNSGDKLSNVLVSPVVANDSTITDDSPIEIETTFTIPKDNVASDSSKVITPEEKALANSALEQAKAQSETVLNKPTPDNSVLHDEDDIFKSNDEKLENSDLQSAVKNRPSVLAGLSAKEVSDVESLPDDNLSVTNGTKNNLQGSDSSSKNKSVESKILASTVPSMELEDQVVPSDVKQDLNIEKKLTDSAKENSDESTLTITKIPEKTPGAAAITQGQSEPIPEKSVVDNVADVKEKTGFFSKIASIFGKKTVESPKNVAESVTTPVATVPNLMTLMSKGSPLDSLMYSLKVQANNTALPDALREEAKNYLDKLENPIDDLPSVANWLNFTSGPMSPTSPQALALHQWAFMLLSIRFAQLGKSVDKFLKKDVDLMEDRFDETLDEMKASIDAKGKNNIPSLLDETLDQIVRYQNPNKENLPLLFQYIPLPPTYDGGREGGFNARPVIEEDGKKSWHLNFVFDLENLGPIEIKAEAKLPELKISVVASTFNGLQKVQEALPTLKEKLQDLGITTRNATARMGKVHIREKNDRPVVEVRTKKDGSTFSVDI